MKRIIEIIFVLIALLMFVSSAEAIKVNTAEVQNGVTVVKGNRAEGNATITWEGTDVTQSNNGGSFQFSGIVPSDDCVGTLSDGVETIEVAVSGCEVSGLLATGQTMAFQADKNDGIAGNPVDVEDDGTLQLGFPLSYTVSGDGLTITDNNTGLMWEIKVVGTDCLHCDNDTYSWSRGDAIDTIWDWLDDVNAEGGTGYASFNDWRIPNIRELLSIVNYGQGEIHPDFGPTRSQYWTSTSPIPAGAAMEVEFGGGLVKRFDWGSTLHIRAVRGP